MKPLSDEELDRVYRQALEQAKAQRIAPQPAVRIEDLLKVA